MLEYLTVRNSRVFLDGATLYPDKAETVERVAALKEALQSTPIAAPLLLAPGKSEPITIVKLMEKAIALRPGLIGGIHTNDPPKPVKLNLGFSDPNDRYSIDTSLGHVQIASMKLHGTVQLTETKVPITKTMQYTQLDTGKSISQIVSFEFDLGDRQVAVEMRRLEKTGETHVVVRPGRSSPE